MSQAPFQKFVPKKKNSVIKEEHKQAKKKAKKDRAAAIDKRFEEKRKAKFEARNLREEFKKTGQSQSQLQNTKPTFQTNQPQAGNNKPQIQKVAAVGALSMPLNK